MLVLRILFLIESPQTSFMCSAVSMRPNLTVFDRPAVPNYNLALCVLVIDTQWLPQSEYLYKLLVMNVIVHSSCCQF
jgi:hypothetical protein